MHVKNALTPELLLKAYRYGMFPMAESRDDPDVFWVEPEQRGIIPLAHFHVPRRLAKTVRTTALTIRVNTQFRETVRACAALEANRPSSWINADIEQHYTALHEIGHAHSVECWSGDGLAGGLYGVSLGAAFFGESMFSRVRDASKIALVHLVARLKYGGFRLLDTQFLTDHLTQFGARNVDKVAYKKLLAGAVDQPADFLALAADCPPQDIIQLSTQTS